MIRTVDTDVVVLAAAHFQGLPNIEQLWIAFETGRDFRHIPIHEIASAICPQMAKGLLFFRAFTGCNVTSYFTNRGKKKEIRTEDLACMAIYHRQFVHPVIAVYSKHT